MITNTFISSVDFLCNFSSLVSYHFQFCPDTVFSHFLLIAKIPGIPHKRHVEQDGDTDVS